MNDPIVKRILITNDDGINAPGLKVLEQIARNLAEEVWVVAPGQGGQNSSRRRTYGHSLVCDPWGKVVSEFDEGPGMACANLDLEQLHQLRSRMPVWEHRRL